MKEREMTLGEWLEEWLLVYKAQTVQENTAKRYQQIMDMICRCEESRLLLSELYEKDLARLMGHLQMLRHHSKPYSRSSLKKAKEMLAQSLRQARADGLICENIWSDLVTPLAPKKKILPLTHQQQTIIESAAERDPQGHLIFFLLDTGLRRSEMINLTWEDYNPEEGTIRIRKSKTPAGVRVVYLIDRARRIIEHQPAINEFIFNNTRCTHISDSSLCRLVERIRKSTHINSFSCHVCRHTFVTRLCEKGVSAKAIAQIIGHANTEYVLDIYAQLEQSELRRAIYALEREAS